MHVALPRLTGTLALGLSPWLIKAGLTLMLPVAAVATGWWVLACVMLVRTRHVREASVTLAMLSLFAVLRAEASDGPAFALVMWMALALAVTEGRPHERALLLRVCVTVVYLFAALTKLNPSFISGEQLVALTQTRSHLAAFEPLAASGWGVALSVGVIVAEVCLPLGLWLRATRRGAAAFGVGLHLTFVAAASITPVSVLHGLALNGLLVVGYLAFFAGTSEASRAVADTDRAPAIAAS